MGPSLTLLRGTTAFFLAGDFGSGGGGRRLTRKKKLSENSHHLTMLVVGQLHWVKIRSPTSCSIVSSHKERMRIGQPLHVPQKTSHGGVPRDVGGRLVVPEGIS